MVLWEITLGTAYFLGLKKTYKLALKIQQKLISPKHPQIRESLQRRTRFAFDMALKIHRTIQERDIEVGRNLGNWILRWLDRMKPEAQIRTKQLHPPTNVNNNLAKHSNNLINNKPPGFQKYSSRSVNRESAKRLFTSVQNAWPKTLPTMAMMMRPMRPAGHSSTQIRPYNSSIGSGLSTGSYGKFGFRGVIRDDIRQWIMHN